MRENSAERLEVVGNEFYGGPFRDFENIAGVHLASSILWFDNQRKNGLNFLSSALAGDISKNRRFLCTEATLKLASRGRGKLDVLTAPYEQSLAIGGLDLSLHPAGHLPGSAMLRVVRDDRVVVYAAEVTTQDSATARPASPVACDVLAIPATYGRRSVRFPPRQEVLDDIVRFIEDAFLDKRHPVLLTQPLGTAQELLASLGKMGYKFRVHRSVADVAKVYQSLGVTLPPFKRFSKVISKGEVGIFPTILRTTVDSILPEARLAFVGPKAIDATYIHQLGVADAFALSNIADYSELLNFIRASGAEEVFLTGGEINEFGAQLRSLGLRVYDLRPQEQLSLFS